MASICKKCGGKKEESDVICDYCHKAQERSSTNQVGRKVAIMPCKKCGGKKQESDVICDYCHKAQEEPIINQVKMPSIGQNIGSTV